MRLLIIGVNQAGHMGSYFAAAARQLGIEHMIMDANAAEATGRLSQMFHWRLRGKRPARLTSFGRQVIDVCRDARPELVLTTGRAPLEVAHVKEMRALGSVVINYSTDDPWNRGLLAPYFLEALPAYDAIFTTRRANIEDFIRCGVRNVHYLAFGYDPEVHRPWPENLPAAPPCDVMFVGGCDTDRLPLITALVDSGLNLALFGGYWNRHGATRAYWRGMAGQDAIRSASATAKICLCLVRRANRDGHVMRSFEAAAIGGCVLAEDTEDHRELFSDAAFYFATQRELIEQAKRLVDDAETRKRLAQRLRARLAYSDQTYANRLATMFRLSPKRSLPGERRVISHSSLASNLPDAGLRNPL